MMKTSWGYPCPSLIVVELNCHVVLLHCGSLSIMGGCGGWWSRETRPDLKACACTTTSISNCKVLE
jgi:hypothetical protein